MPELRHDPIQKRWVIIATERARRPHDFQIEIARETAQVQTSVCAFCEGNETETPPEIFAYRKEGSQPNRAGWLVRVIPNKFPALKIEGDLENKAVGAYDRMNGIGAHEVIIETPEHNATLADMTAEQLELIISAYRERLRDLMNDRRFKYILIFKNYGVSAGASLAHPHTQLIATPVTPRTVSIELKSAKDHYQLKERCLFCDLLLQELEDGSRIVAENDLFIAAAPYASRFPFEIFLAPKNHSQNFANISVSEVQSLARIMKDVLARVKAVLRDPPYNFLFHTGPNVHARPRRTTYWDTLEHDFHWHIEFLPRLTRMAGFEWGTGFYINPTPPEEAAKYLREADI